MLEGLLSRLRLVVSRARIRLTDPDAIPRRAQVTLLAGETVDRVPVVQQYGFASRPREGAEGVVVCVGADRADPVLIGTLDRSHPGPELEVGEAALFGPKGDWVKFLAGGGVVVHAPNGATIRGRTTIEGDVDVRGSVSASGDLSDAAGALSRLRGAYNAHTHVETDSVTNPPVPPDL
ncbi:MAG: phage baseplate assembly protein [Planctomycetota bacterium]